MSAESSQHLPLAPAQFHVLVALSDGDRHGYAIMQAVEEASGGVVRMGPATVYGTLQRLTDIGLVEEVPASAESDGNKRRRCFRLTGLGRAVCIAEADRLSGLARMAHANLRPGLA
jgi:DNA-binding PadR family transcriptional regulator